MFTIILIILSLIFLAYSIFLCRKMIKSFTRSIHKKAGHIMLSLMIIFFVGYIIYLGFSYDLLFTNFLAALLFFLTAFFIMLVIQVNHSLIIGLTMKTLELKEFSEKLLNETHALTSSKVRLEKIKSMLEEKNKELEEVLDKVSSEKLGLARAAEKEEKSQSSKRSGTLRNEVSGAQKRKDVSRELEAKPQTKEE